MKGERHMSTSVSSSIQPCELSYSEISSLAEEVAEVLRFPRDNDLDSVIRTLSGKIEYHDNSQLNQQEYATIIVNDDKSFVIRLATFLFPLQQRYSIAHELGHFVLHSRLGEEKLTAAHNAGTISEQAEIEAHIFATSFLVPSKELRGVREKYNENITRIAAHFLVPEPIVRQRIASLAK